MVLYLFWNIPLHLKSYNHQTVPNIRNRKTGNFILPARKKENDHNGICTRVAYVQYDGRDPIIFHYIILSCPLATNDDDSLIAFASVMDPDFLPFLCWLYMRVRVLSAVAYELCYFLRHIKMCSVLSWSVLFFCRKSSIILEHRALKMSFSQPQQYRPTCASDAWHDGTWQPCDIAEITC